MRQNVIAFNVGGQLFSARAQRISPSNEFFTKESFRLSEQAYNGLPIELTHDAAGGVWVVSEFGNYLAHVDAQGRLLTYRIPLARAPASPDYDTRPFVNRRSRSIHPNSESIVLDGDGRVWFPENGSALNWLLPPEAGSYSRIVGFDPHSERFCAIPVPDSGANVLGVSWDAARGRIWFLQSGNNGLVWFDPKQFDFAAGCATINAYEWGIYETGELLNPVPVPYCTSRGQQRCFHKTVIPTDPYEVLTADLLTVQQGGEDAGAIWFSRYWENATLSRFDPEAGEVQHFPIHTGHALNPDPTQPVSLANLILPWNVDIHPDGDLLFPSQGLGQLIRFDIQRFLDPGYAGECERLDASGQNPCMIAFEFPDLGEALLHSGALDQYGNYWFSTWSPRSACPEEESAGASPRRSPPSIGFINRDWTDMVYFDHLALEPRAPDQGTMRLAAPQLVCTATAAGPAPLWGFTGITVTDDSHVWLTNFWQGYVHRLTLIAGAVDPYCVIRECPGD